MIKLKKLLNKYEKIYKFSLVGDLAVFFLFCFGGILNSFFMDYAVLAICPLFLLRFFLRFLKNNVATNLSNIVIIAVAAAILLTDMRLFDFLTSYGIMFLCMIYVDLKLIRGEKIKSILKKVYGYPHFNELIIRDEMKDSDISNMVNNDIETALSNKLIEKEIAVNSLSSFKKIGYITNITVAVMFLAGLYLLNYGNYLKKSIDNAALFEPKNTAVNTYVKGKMDNISVCASSGDEYSYWVLVDGKYLSVVVPEKINEPFWLWVEEDENGRLGNGLPVDFVGKTVKYDAEEANVAALKKQLPGGVSDSEINTDFSVKVLIGDEHEIYKKFADILIYISYGYVVLFIPIRILAKRRRA
jgi:hypothetical protein